MSMSKVRIPITLAIVCGLLTGCTWWTKPQIPPEPQIVTVVKKEPLRIYQPPVPAEIDLLDVNWFIITEENLEQRIEEIEKMLGGEFVIFALVPDGYEKMSENLQEIRRYMRQQTELIVYYRKATSESEGTTSEDWLDTNKELNSP